MQSENGTIDNINATIIKLRKIVRFLIDSNCNESALFWADKAATISNENAKDIYWLAQSMFRCGEYNRAALLIRKKGLEKNHPLFRWLAGLCLLEARKYSDALLVMTGDGELDDSNISVNVTSPASYLSTSRIANDDILEGFTPQSLRAALLVLKGRIYEKLERRNCAVQCFKNALKFDVYCYDAFQSLVQHQMLTAAEEKELMASLPFKSQCGNYDALPFVYEQLLNKYQQFTTQDLCFSSYKPPSRIATNLDIKEAQAEKIFYACDYERCYRITEDILKDDPYHRRTLPIHISCLVELKKTNALFYLAHKLVDEAPDLAISWYAVGCYYFLISKQIMARKYLSKAVYLDNTFGPAWLAYGHTFAKENEHDQAIAAYFSAAKLMRGCHLPLLCVGVQCGLINNPKSAERFFTQAQSIAPNDPFIIHEMGTIAFQNGNFIKAETHFLAALVEVQKRNKLILVERWEPLLNNLGHTFRKQKKYAEAISYHRQALVVLPQNPSTLANIAFVQALQENFMDAIDTFHKVLSLKQDDSFSLTMLTYLLEQLVYITPTIHDPRGNEE